MHAHSKATSRDSCDPRYAEAEQKGLGRETKPSWIQSPLFLPLDKLGTQASCLAEVKQSQHARQPRDHAVSSHSAVCEFVLKPFVHCVWARESMLSSILWGSASPMPTVGCPGARAWRMLCQSSPTPTSAHSTSSPALMPCFPAGTTHAYSVSTAHT